jgi:prolyl-tRNA synthetase
LAYMAADLSRRDLEKTRPVVVFMRGDHMLNEAKLTSAIGTAEFRPMQPEEIEHVFKSPAGFLGPVNIPNLDGVIVLVDEALRGRKNLIAGANQENYHLKNVTPDRDFKVQRWADLRNAAEREGCPNCGSPLKVAKAVEIGHIFKLGYKYSESMGARVLDKDGKEVTPIMGSYGIGIERILTSAIEQSNDENGFWLSQSISPFDVVVTPTNVSDPKLLDTALAIAGALEKAGFDVLLDDRDERPGVKFKDADLIGVPYRVNVGKKVTEGMVEVIRRSTRESRDATISEITQALLQMASQS